MLTIRYQAKRRYRSVVLCATVSNTYLPVLVWLKERWGGTISTPKQAKSQKHKVSHLWMTASRKAAIFLTDVSPFVRVKRGQVDNALAFQATKRPRGAGRKRLTDAEWAGALAFLRRQRQLNARGPAVRVALDASWGPRGE